MAWKIRRHRKKQRRSRVSAGLLIFRRNNIIPSVCLRIPAGRSSPEKMTEYGQFLRRSRPGRGLVNTRSDFDGRRREIGIKPSGNWIPLGSIKQKAQDVHAWASRAIYQKHSNLKIESLRDEWPPRSGVLKEFPEIDLGGQFFPEEIARRKIKFRHADSISRSLAGGAGTDNDKKTYRLSIGRCFPGASTHRNP